MEESGHKPWNFHTCKFCSYRSKSAFKIRRHTRSHERRTETDIFICNSKTLELLGCECCKFETNFKVNLTEHLRVFHEGKEANEEIETILRCYRCKNCDFEAHSVLVLAKHGGECNNFSLKPNNSDKWYEFNTSGVKWCKCKHCRPYKTTNTKYIKKHQTEHLESDKCTYKTLQKEHNISVPTDTKRFECSQCDFKAKEKGTLKKHVVAKHTNPEDINWFECTECEYKSKQKGDLTKHTFAKHANPKDISWFKCEKCAYKSKRKCDLVRHVTKHVVDPENWFQCGQCPFTCRLKNGLKKHVIRKHTNPENIRWFECAECNFRSKQKDDLKKHIIVRHVYQR